MSFWKQVTNWQNNILLACDPKAHFSCHTGSCSSTIYPDYSSLPGLRSLSKMYRHGQSRWNIIRENHPLYPSIHVGYLRVFTGHEFLCPDIPLCVCVCVLVCSQGRERLWPSHIHAYMYRVVFLARPSLATTRILKTIVVYVNYCVMSKKSKQRYDSTQPKSLPSCKGYESRWTSWCVQYKKLLNSSKGTFKIDPYVYRP